MGISLVEADDVQTVRKRVKKDKIVNHEKIIVDNIIIDNKTVTDSFDIDMNWSFAVYGSPPVGKYREHFPDPGVGTANSIKMELTDIADNKKYETAIYHPKSDSQDVQIRGGNLRSFCEKYISDIPLVDDYKKMTTEQKSICKQQFEERVKEDRVKVFVMGDNTKPFIKYINDWDSKTKYAQNGLDRARVTADMFLNYIKTKYGIDHNKIPDTSSCLLDNGNVVAFMYSSSEISDVSIGENKIFDYYNTEKIWYIFCMHEDIQKKCDKFIIINGTYLKEKLKSVGSPGSPQFTKFIPHVYKNGNIFVWNDPDIGINNEDLSDYLNKCELLIVEPPKVVDTIAIRNDVDKYDIVDNKDYKKRHDEYNVNKKIIKEEDLKRILGLGYNREWNRLKKESDDQIEKRKVEKGKSGKDIVELPEIELKWADKPLTDQIEKGEKMKGLIFHTSGGLREIILDIISSLSKGHKSCFEIYLRSYLYRIGFKDDEVSNTLNSIIKQGIIYSITYLNWHIVKEYRKKNIEEDNKLFLDIFYTIKNFSVEHNWKYGMTISQIAKNLQDKYLKSEIGHALKLMKDRKIVYIIFNRCWYTNEYERYITKKDIIEDEKLVLITEWILPKDFTKRLYLIFQPGAKRILPKVEDKYPMAIRSYGYDKPNTIVRTCTLCKESILVDSYMAEYDHICLDCLKKNKIYIHLTVIDNKNEKNYSEDLLLTTGGEYTIHIDQQILNGSGYGDYVLAYIKLDNNHELYIDIVKKEDYERIRKMHEYHRYFPQPIDKSEELEQVAMEEDNTRKDNNMDDNIVDKKDIGKIEEGGKEKTGIGENNMDNEIIDFTRRINEKYKKWEELKDTTKFDEREKLIARIGELNRELEETTTKLKNIDNYNKEIKEIENYFIELMDHEKKVVEEKKS